MLICTLQNTALRFNVTMNQRLLVVRVKELKATGSTTRDFNSLIPLHGQ